MTGASHYRADRAFAEERDAADVLSAYRERFHYRPDKIYVDGNSLGLMCRSANASVARAVQEWCHLAIDGWAHASPPWLGVGERLGEQVAPLVGASPHAVVATGSTTVNLHNLVSAFYQPTAGRAVVLTDNVTFPSDLYALQAQVQGRGLDPAHAIRFAPLDSSGFIDERGVVAAMTDDVALVLLSSAIYTTGQLLDVEKISQAARDRGIVAGWDCSHTVGAVPHAFDQWGVDFAFWCGYKYLNGGPGSPAFLYVNAKHDEIRPGLPGWWGYASERRFDMRSEFEPARGAAGWQISTPSILASAPLEASLAITAEAGVDRIRAKSLDMTAYLIHLTDVELAPHGFRVATPREALARGGHVALTHPTHARNLFDAAAERGIVGDFRPPNIIRVAPVALYNTYSELWELVQSFRSIAEELGL